MTKHSDARFYARSSQTRPRESKSFQPGGTGRVYLTRSFWHVGSWRHIPIKVGRRECSSLSQTVRITRSHRSLKQAIEEAEACGRDGLYGQYRGKRRAMIQTPTES